MRDPFDLFVRGQILASQPTRKGPARFIPHKPHAKQKEFLKLDCLEALYGGAAGGGKSDALLMAALQYVDIPSYSALLLRRSYTDLSLPGAIMDRSHDWLEGSGALWNDRDKRWTFPSGATLTFGYLDNERDKYRYQSAEFQFIGFDELTQFPEGWYAYLLSRLRRLQDSRIPLRARSASNPGGVGHDWVLRRFISQENEGHRFVPATLADNPFIDQVSYAQTLQNLDPTTRKQLLEGLWIRDSGGLVYPTPEISIIEKAPECSDHILGIDYGFTDSTAFCILGWREHDKTVYILESFKQAGLTPSAAAEIALDLEKRYRFAQIVGDIGGLGKGYAEEARSRFGLPIIPADKNNKRGYIDLLNGDLANGHLKIVRGSNADLIQEMRELPWDKERKHPEPGFEDHLCDAMLYGWRACRAFLAEPKAEQPAYGTSEYFAMERKRIEDQIEADYLKSQKEWWDE